VPVPPPDRTEHAATAWDEPNAHPVPNPADRLAETAALLKIAQEAGGVGAFQWWPETGALDVTDAYRSIFGIGPGPVTSALLVSLVLPEDRHLCGPALHEAGKPINAAQFRIRRADTGEVRWVARNGEFWTPEGRSRRFIGVIRDITGEKASEAQLRANQATLQADNTKLERAIAERTIERDRMWHVSQDAFVIFDRDFNHLAVSPAFEQLLGWSEDEIIHCPPSPLIHPDDLERALKVRDRLRAGEAVNRSENRARHKDGSWRWLAWTAVPEGDRIYAVARDVTAVKARVAEIAAANRALQTQIAEREQVEATLRQMQRLEAVGQLTAGVAHDFNNLLTVILGNLGFLARATTDPSATRQIGMIEAAALRGAALTSQLLAFSRRQRLDARVVDLNETIANMRDLLDSSIGGTVRLSTVLSASLWPALVDPTQIELVILNLALNARDAMAVGGSLRIGTDNRTIEEPLSDAPPGDYVVVRVEDNGTGMTPDVAAKAFEPFFTTKAVGRGSGLGLAQVYGFAKQSGGCVLLDTEPGRGTVVSVLLPRATATTPTPTRAPPSNGPPAGSRQTRRVLLVDDDDAVREISAALLHELGYIVTEVAGGEQALAAVADWAPRTMPDVVLLDFAMPGVNGVEVAAAIRARVPAMPIVFITGYADLTALAAIDHALVLQKPYRETQLQAILDRALPPAPAHASGARESD
jgi:PAS domain S-box-containing protein